jgi:2-dehydro-3-deoxyphosphogluconate aldolase / (4S)-4-hydroxy-2-oxoglutarate aldolase
MDPTLKALGEAGLVPAIKIDDAAKAVDLGKALAEGGVPVAEITFRTPAAADGIRAMRDSGCGVLLGAGTVTNVARAKEAIAAGASYIVAPGMNPSVVDFCLERGMPVIPGVSGPAGIEEALEKGIDILKLFPAELSGGVALIDALSGPYPEVSYLVTGGIGPDNMGPYARHPKVFGIGGSWMAKPAWIEGCRWDEIRSACRESVRLLHNFTLHHLGINTGSAEEAASPLAFLARLGFMAKEGKGSIFAGESFELMKGGGRGEKGHIAIKANNVDRALAYLKRNGVSAIEETIARDGAGTKVAYIDIDIAGFAVHLTRG